MTTLRRTALVSCVVLAAAFACRQIMWWQDSYYGVDARAPDAHIQSVFRMREIWKVLGREWPDLSGKRFVLYAAVKGEAGYDGFWPLHFYSPGWDGEFAPWPEYEALDLQSLGSQDVGHLTSFAGRRNHDPRYHLAPGTGGRGDPILADAAFDEWVIVLFANGRAKRYRRSRLTSRDGRLVFGDGATHPVLRALSLD